MSLAGHSDFDVSTPIAIGLEMPEFSVSNFEQDHERANLMKPSQVSVVVVIPYYNGKEFIERALKSAIAQSVPPTEIIVVDDGSNPVHAEALKRIVASYPVKVLHKENGGQGSARNYGVANSKSDYICFLDQDDYYLPNHIEVLVKAIPKKDKIFGFAYADLFEADKHGNIVRMGVIKHHSSHPKRSIFDLIAGDMFVLPSASIISRQAFLEVRGFDEQFMGYEDDDLFIRIFRAGFNNKFVDKCVTVWCIHAESTSYSIKMSRSRIRYFSKLAQMFPDDLEKSRYCMRDILIPRFGIQIIGDLVKSKRLSPTDREQTIDYFLTYKKMIDENKSVAKSYKHKISRYKWVYCDIPDSIFSVLRSISRIPLLSNLKRKYF